MTPADIVLPIVATSALGAALLVPLRDQGPGRRASLGRGSGPLRVAFETPVGPDATASALVAADQLGPGRVPDAPGRGPDAAHPDFLQGSGDETGVDAAVEGQPRAESADRVASTRTPRFRRFFAWARRPESRSRRTMGTVETSFVTVRSRVTSAR